MVLMCGKRLKSEERERERKNRKRISWSCKVRRNEDSALHSGMEQSLLKIEQK
jgi:hypothetical protein